MDTRTAQTVIAEIREIDARIRERWSGWETAHAADMDQVLDQVGEMGRIDERNANDRERIHELALELVKLLGEVLPVIEEAAGDAYAYRLGEEADVEDLEVEDREPIARYIDLTKALGIAIH